MLSENIFNGLSFIMCNDKETTMKSLKNRHLSYIFAIAVVIFCTALDQFTKYLAVKGLKGKPPYVVIEDVFQLEYLENRGAAFGLFQNQRFFFFLSVAVICCIVIWFFRKVPMDKSYLPLRLCASLIVAGALGNFIDRVRLNYVVDFFYFKLIDFPIFNVADIYVTVSTGLFVILLCFYYKEEDIDRILHSRK